MKDEWVDELVIENVSQAIINTGYVQIMFEVNRFPYRMNVSKNEKGLFEPSPVRHYNFQEDEVCELCNKNGYRLDPCTVFRKKRLAFFHRVIQHPRIRLEWLYMPHVLEE